MGARCGGSESGPDITAVTELSERADTDPSRGLSAEMFRV